MHGSTRLSAFLLSPTQFCTSYQHRRLLLLYLQVPGMISSAPGTWRTRNEWTVPRRGRLDRDLKCRLSNGSTAASLGGLEQTGGRPEATSNHALNRFKTPSFALCC